MISLDFLISIGSLGLGFSTLPGLINRKSQFPRWSSFITTGFLTYYIPLFYLSGLTLTSGTLFVQAITWWLIFVFRPIKRKSEKERTLEFYERELTGLTKRIMKLEKKKGKSDPDPDERLFQ